LTDDVISIAKRGGGMMETAPRVPTVALPLAPSARQRLLAAGFADAGDLERAGRDGVADGAPAGSGWLPADGA
jgi:hypothetical protein